MLWMMAVIALTMPQVEVEDQRALIAQTAPLTADGTVVGARVQIQVEPDGDVENCMVREYAGPPERAAQLCRLIEQQRIKPARDAHGAAVHAVMDMTLWAQPAHNSPLPPLPASPPFLELTVEHLPAGTDDPLSVPVGLVLDETGRVTMCGVFEERFEPYAGPACAVLEKETFSAIHDGNGTAVRYATRVSVKIGTGSITSTEG